MDQIKNLNIVVGKEYKAMGKIIIDQKLIGAEFIDVVFMEADKLAEEKGLNKEVIGKEIATAGTPEEFIEVLKTHFGDEIKVRLNV